MNQISYKISFTISLAIALFVFQIPSLHAFAVILGAPRVTHVTDEIQNLAKFAVSQHNNNENAMLEFTKVLKVEEQVVAGALYSITLEANDGGQKKVYEAKVWVKPWMNFKQLTEFKRIEGISSCPPADHGMEQGWIAVPTHDSGVQNAAEQAIKAIQLRSNSLFPYELLDIISAKSKAIGNNNRYDLFLKVRRGDKEEKFRVEVNKSADGKFILCSMEEVPL